MSKKTFFSNALILVMISIASLSAADTILVPADYPSIQEAIDASTDGDTVIVSPGTYYEGIEFKGKNITLQSEDPTSPSVVENTVIGWQEGTPNYTIVTFAGTENDKCVLSGFTITHDQIYKSYPGIEGNGTRATIMHNRIIKNGEDQEHARYGGGISGCHGLIKSNVIAENYAVVDGGGLYECNGVIEGNIIKQNYAKGFFGGGLANCHGIIRNNEIILNYSQNHGGGIANSEGIIENNIIRKNTAIEGGGLFRCYGHILYNTIEQNHGLDHGGGLASCHCLVKGNLIKLNKADEYGGAAFQCSGLFIGNIIEKNDARKLGGAFSLCSGDILDNEVKQNISVYGGAFYKCSGRIAFNDINENTAEKIGGAFFNMSEGTIENNTIRYNNAYENGGAFNSCHVPVRNNIIENNTSDKDGGAFHNCNGEIQNNIIQANIAQYGGAFSLCSGKIENNVVHYNGALGGGGFFDCDASIQNCIIWSNAASIGSQLYNSSPPEYSCIQDWIMLGNHNTGLDPLFTSTLSNDFHLKMTSPCIDAGNPEEQYNDAILPPGLETVRNDMGAYGGPYNSGWLRGLPGGALADLTQYGDVWTADNEGAPPFYNPERLSWLGFSYKPEEGWLPMKGDFANDGFDDLVQITEYGDAWVYTNPETGYTPSRWGWLGYSYDETVTENGNLPLTGDVDGDEDDDLIQVTSYSDVWVATSSETMYDAPTRWGWLGFRFKRGDESNAGAIPVPGDVNADGMDDLIQVTEYGDVWVALSNGNYYANPTSWGWAGFRYQPEAGWLPLVGDFNGDGMCDLVQITPTGDPWVILSDGNSFDLTQRWGWIGISYNESDGSYPLAADINADGKTDLIQVKPDGSAWVAFSLGDSFDNPEFWGFTGFRFSREDGWLPFYLNY